MDCLPDNLRGRQYYHPTAEGREKALAQRLEEIRRLREGARKEISTTEDTKEHKGKKKS
jgi:putative ATPase